MVKLYKYIQNKEKFTPKSRSDLGIIPRFAKIYFQIWECVFQDLAILTLPVGGITRSWNVKIPRSGNIYSQIWEYFPDFRSIPSSDLDT